MNHQYIPNSGNGILVYEVNMSALFRRIHERIKAQPKPLPQFESLEDWWHWAIDPILDEEEKRFLVE